MQNCVGAIVGDAVGFAEPLGTQQSFSFSKQQSIKLSWTRELSG